MVDLNRLTREFLLGEVKRPGVESYIQSISEILNAIMPRSQKDMRRVEIARSNLQEVRRHCRKMQEQISVLEEQLTILEESKEG
jgi:hypothetical protein